MTEETATKECPHCFTEIDARATTCPNCGKDVKKKGNIWHLATFIMAAALLAAIVGLFTDISITLVALFVILVAWVIRRNF